MTAGAVLGVACAVAVAYLLAAYAFGGPVVLVRTLVIAIRDRRLRYRGRADDVLATSRFTIPVSVILPTEGATGIGDAVQHLLELQYPEFEVIVVNDGTAAVLDELRERFGLTACEVFFRRTIKTAPVGGIFRSPQHDRLLVVDCQAFARADALNCGVNLSRYRYVGCASVQARYARTALLDAMHAAVEDPGTVVGVSTALGPPAAQGPGADVPPAGLIDVLQRLSALRGFLARRLRRRLSVSPDALPGMGIWRRDVLVETNGFSLDVPSEQIEMTFRVHRHMLRTRQPYRMVHVTTPIGVPVTAPSLSALLTRRLERQHSMARVLWLYRGMILNPRYQRIGMVDLPQYLFAALVVPWLELVCLVALPFSVVAGVLTLPGLVLAYCAIGLGNAVLLNAAMLAAPWPADGPTLLRLLLLGPLEVFVSRPVQLYSRMAGLLRILFSRSAPAGV